MPKVMITLEGAEKLERALAVMEAKVAKKITKKAMRAGAKVILRAAKARAPVDTGQMKKALTVRAARQRKRGEASFNLSFDTKKYPDLVTTSETFQGVGQARGSKRFFYPAIVEYGTSTQPAKPFMRPVFDSQKAAALRVIMGQFRKGITDARAAR